VRQTDELTERLRTAIQDLANEQQSAGAREVSLA